MTRDTVNQKQQKRYTRRIQHEYIWLLLIYFVVLYHAFGLPCISDEHHNQWTNGWSCPTVEPYSERSHLHLSSEKSVTSSFSELEDARTVVHRSRILLDTQARFWRSVILIPPDTHIWKMLKIRNHLLLPSTSLLPWPGSNHPNITSYFSKK